MVGLPYLLAVGRRRRRRSCPAPCSAGWRSARSAWWTRAFPDSTVSAVVPADRPGIGGHRHRSQPRRHRHRDEQQLPQRLGRRPRAASAADAAEPVARPLVELPPLTPRAERRHADPAGATASSSASAACRPYATRPSPCPREASPVSSGRTAPARRRCSTSSTGLQEPVVGCASSSTGKDVTAARPHRLARIGIARTFQRLEIFGSLSVRDNVLMAAETHRRWARDESIDPGDVADAVIAQVGLQSVASVRADTLPTGTARLVELARALATRPRVLLLDEPSSGLSGEETLRCRALLREFTSTGLAILLVEHDMGFVMDLCQQDRRPRRRRGHRRGNAGRGPVEPRVLTCTRHDLGSSTTAEPECRSPMPRHASWSATPEPGGSRRASHGARPAPLAIEMAGVSAGYGGITALFEVDLRVTRGQVCRGARAERRRQVDAAQGRVGTGATHVRDREHRRPPDRGHVHGPPRPRWPVRRPGRPWRVPEPVGGGEPQDGDVRRHRPTTPSSRRRSSASRSSVRAGVSSPARSPAASSRCCRWPARSPCKPDSPARRRAVDGPRADHRGTALRGDRADRGGGHLAADRGAVRPRGAQGGRRRCAARPRQHQRIGARRRRSTTSCTPPTSAASTSPRRREPRGLSERTTALGDRQAAEAARRAAPMLPRRHGEQWATVRPGAGRRTDRREKGAR